MSWYAIENAVFSAAIFAYLHRLKKTATADIEPVRAKNVLKKGFIWVF